MRTFFAIPAMILGLSVSDARAYVAEWSASGLYTDIVVADCRNCEEDAGILIACTGNGLPAKVTVNAAASEFGQDGELAPVVFDIDGYRYVKSAKTVNYGLIGLTPEFSLPVNDPLVYALQSGNRAVVTFNGRSSTIGLRGSRAALDIFMAHCGWTPAGYRQNQQRLEVQNNQNQNNDNRQSVFGVAPGESHSKPNANGELWFTSTLESDTGNKYTLTYGIPETDAIAFQATCKFNSTDPYPISLALDIGNKQDRDRAEVEFILNGNRLVKSGTVFQAGGEFYGINVAIEPFDLVWEQLARATEVKFGLRGIEPNTIPGSPETVKSFLGRCLPD